MRLWGLLLIFAGIATTGAGLADVQYVGMNLAMAATGIGCCIAGAALIAIASKRRDDIGFEVKPVGGKLTEKKEENDHG